jgi:hypothetical protein
MYQKKNHATLRPPQSKEKEKQIVDIPLHNQGTSKRGTSGNQPSSHLQSTSCTGTGRATGSGRSSCAGRGTATAAAGRALGRGSIHTTEDGTGRLVGSSLGSGGHVGGEGLATGGVDHTNHTSLTVLSLGAVYILLLLVPTYTSDES